MQDDIDREVAIEQFLSANRFDDAVAFALTIRPEWERAESLALIARAAWKSRDAVRAMQLWSIAIEAAKVGERSDSPQDSLDSSSVLWEIAENLAAAGALEKARHLASGILNEGKRSQAIKFVNAIASGSLGSFDF